MSRYRLGLRQVHAPVQEGALCELPCPGLPDAKPHERAQDLGQDDGRAVAVKFAVLSPV
jgi:hypothetical protein